MASVGDSGRAWWLYFTALLLQKGPEWAYDGENNSISEPQSLPIYSTQWFLIVGAVFGFVIISVLARWACPGGCAWGALQGPKSVPGPRGWPIIGSLLTMHGATPHRCLANLASNHGANRLMAMSFGNTRVIISSNPETAREILNSACFADRPIKQSAQLLLFHRAIGFAPYGQYWRSLRRIAGTHFFSPKRIAAQEANRQLETTSMLKAIDAASSNGASVQVRHFLQHASLNNIMQSVFGRRYECGNADARALTAMVREGYELLGAFNWADHLPCLLNFQNIEQRCAALVPRVSGFVQKIIDEHRLQQKGCNAASHATSVQESNPSFLSVLLSLSDNEKLEDSDMVSVLWEMVFRGTDTVAILTEWILAEVVLHPSIQKKLHAELDNVVGSGRTVQEADISKLSYLQAVIKETLRMHPPGPLLSWARLAIHDTVVGGHEIPAGTTAMVNMWSITHNPAIWADPEAFTPERFLSGERGCDVDVRGNDLRLAPFGAGRRVCPGRALGQATVEVWVARLLHHFEWHEVASQPIELQEILKLSCEMKQPLTVRPVRRIPLAF